MLPLISDQIAKACKAHSVEAVTANWPLVQSALEAKGIGTPASCIGAAATIAVETAHTFKPINEFGNTAYFNRLYDHRTDLGNVIAGDGALFHGRGYIQITGRANYRKYGELVGVDLEKHPDLALDPEIAAKVFAEYWSRLHIGVLCEQRKWDRVRRLVNGGLNGWDDFYGCVQALCEACGIETALNPEL